MSEVAALQPLDGGRPRIGSVLRAKLAEDRPLLGMGIVTATPAAVELAGLTGFDYVFIDTEHTAIALSGVEELIRAANVHDVATIVRVPDHGAASIRRVLELGADAVKVPHVTSGGQAAAIVARARFAPAGERGTAGFVRAAGYAASWPGWTERANRDLCVDVMIEDVAGVEAAEEIVSTPGVDLVSFGQVDYSVSAGIAGQVHDSKVDAALARVCKAANAADVAVFTIVLPPTDVDAAERLVDTGVRLLTFGNELTHLHGTFRKLAETAVRRIRR